MSCNPQSPSSPLSAYAMSDSSISSQQPRQRLRPWLCDQINNGRTPGLEWMDKNEMIFKIPWKHFGRPGVDEYNDAMLFRNWALHTKKYQEGQASDISTWKTRFRCALHKLPDIEELSQLNKTDGDEPYRVYQFLKKPGRNGESDTDSISLSQSSYTNSPAPSSVRGLSFDEINSDFINNGYMQPTRSGLFTDSLLPDDLDLPISDLDLVSTLIQDNQQLNQYEPSVIHNGSMHCPAMSIERNMMPQYSDQRLSVKLFYGDVEVGERLIDNPQGLRIAFNPPPPLPDNVVQEEASHIVRKIFGPFQAEQIYFPATADDYTMEILNIMKRGLVLQAINGEIRATRLCRAKVFYSDSVAPVYLPQELKREHTTTVFDYSNDFLVKLRAYSQGLGPVPTYERFFSFGQMWSQSKPLKNNYIYVSVTHCLSHYCLNEVQKQKHEVLKSEPNPLDVIAKQIEDLSLGQKI